MKILIFEPCLSNLLTEASQLDTSLDETTRTLKQFILCSYVCTS